MRRTHEKWLKELTSIPTAAGREQRVIAWVQKWVDQRSDLRMRADRAGNLVITRNAKTTLTLGARTPETRLAKNARPIYITAHLDHPAFVVHTVNRVGTIELEFRGGVHDPYFKNAPIEIFDSNDQVYRARIISLDSTAKPFKRVIARLDSRPRPRPRNSGNDEKKHAGDAIKPGDVGRWVFTNHNALPRIHNGLFHAHACDDLAAVAAVLAMLDALRGRADAAHVGVLLTRAEEIGFIGAIAVCKLKSVPKSARLICLENSRSYAESPIGGGPIVRVGDKSSVFGPALTNRISAIMAEHQKTNPKFKWQRKLMPGGTCEATTFSTYGYESTCLCLPLGNYHNMIEIDGAVAGKRNVKVGPEFISLDDYHGLIEMLIVSALQMDSAKIPTLGQRMEELHRTYKFVL